MDEPKPPELRDTGMTLFGLPVYETNDLDAPPIQLGSCADGLHFTPNEPIEPREPITVPKEFTISGTFMGDVATDDSPVWRTPAFLAANASNN